MKTIPLTANLQDLVQEYVMHYKPHLIPRTGEEAGLGIVLVKTLRPAFRAAMPEGWNVHQALFTQSAPGYAVHTHTDRTRPPFYDRWHLPLVADETGTVLVEDGVEHVMVPGYWYGTVKYWLPHSVKASEVERVHLIVDCMIL